MSIYDSTYLVGTAEGVTSFTEHQELGLFGDDVYRQAFADAGLEVVDADGRSVRVRALCLPDAASREGIACSERLGDGLTEHAVRAGQLQLQERRVLLRRGEETMPIKSVVLR